MPIVQGHPFHFLIESDWPGQFHQYVARNRENWWVFATKIQGRFRMPSNEILHRVTLW